ncbi:hypothetical protein [Subtercola sp. Z020]|uniref:hypothetical protein n=1 Tax=Subtercola sp. Z020 TaxID=2080582 RepID=UPI0011B08C80|nr:hypothetical protein [Subtercola sp. Z020]
MDALTPVEEGRSACVRLLSSALHDRALNPEQFEAERADFETLHPGLPDLVEHALEPENVFALSSVADDDLRYESVMSSIASPLKRFCAGSEIS